MNVQPNSAPVSQQLACEAVCISFFDALDRRDDAVCCDFFDPAGVWERQGKPLRGRQEIAATLAARPAGRETAHILTNMRVEITSPTSAVVSFLLTAYEGTVTPGGGEPVARLAGIRRCRDELTLTDSGWKILRKSSHGLFRGTPAV